jgi:UTP--glucose-1-phosphate uridylyltransferase
VTASHEPAPPAVVTAGGHGTRFRPFTSVVPKEMLPIGSKPALGHVVDECTCAGSGRVFVVARPGDSVVPDYVRRLQVDGAPVEVVTEDVRQGYGNAAPLLTLRRRLAGVGYFAVAFGDDVLVSAGDTSRDLAAMYELARTGADAIVAAQVVSLADIKSFGVVDLVPGRRDRVAGIRQRPDPSTVVEPLALVSRLVLRPQILDLVTRSDAARGEVDLGTAVGVLAAAADVRVHRLESEWITVGDPRRYFDGLTRYWRLQETAERPESPLTTLSGAKEC